MATDDAVSASAQGARYLVLLQIGSRAVTFGLNQLLLRFLSPTLLGSAVQLELYIISTLYFARESLRIATQRRAAAGVQAAVNVSYFSLVLGPPFALFFASVYLRYGLPDVPFAHEALFVNGLAAMVELCSEPAFVAVQQTLLFKIRASAEAIAVVVKTFTTFVLVFWAYSRGLDIGVLPFAAGELAYSTAMSIVFIYRTSSAARADGFSLLPAKLQSRFVLVMTVHSIAPADTFLNLVPKTLFTLALSMYVQTGVKWLLTEGDKMLVAALTTLEEQGMYAVAANYGGLIARMLFRPIEESCRSLFGALCVPNTSESEHSVSNGTEPTQDRKKADNKNVVLAIEILSDIMRAFAICSLIIFSLGPTGAPLLFELVAGRRWAASGAGAVLGMYSIYIPLMALNGVSEAFVAATAMPKDLRRQSTVMAFLSVIFAGSAWFFVRYQELGASGLVFANCVNSLLRIVYNQTYISTYAHAHGYSVGFRRIMPEFLSISVAVGMTAMLASTKDIRTLQLYGILGELARTGSVGVLGVASIVAIERKFLWGCFKRYRGIDEKKNA